MKERDARVVGDLPHHLVVGDAPQRIPIEYSHEAAEDERHDGQYGARSGGAGHCESVESNVSC